MTTTTAEGRRRGTVRPELAELVAPAGLVPKRASDADARPLLERDGAVILSGRSVDPEELVMAAAALLGARLRQVFPIRPQAGDQAEPLRLHCDGANVVVDVHGKTVRLRDPDEDYLFLLCETPAPSGGDSIVVDGYRLVDQLRDGRPELHAFLTGCDVDFFGGWNAPSRGVPLTPRVCRLVEHTRGGRRVVRASDYARPVPREPRAPEHERMLDTYADVIATLTAGAPRFRLERGDVLVLDNYRYLHGRDGFQGRRLVHVMTVLSSDAW